MTDGIHKHEQAFKAEICPGIFATTKSLFSGLARDVYISSHQKNVLEEGVTQSKTTVPLKPEIIFQPCSQTSKCHCRCFPSLFDKESVPSGVTLDVESEELPGLGFLGGAMLLLLMAV